MTRGQKSLLGDDDVLVARPQVVFTLDASRPVVRVLRASVEELAMHAQQLADIDQASKGACLWKAIEPT